MQLNIEYVPLSEITPYTRNAKRHPAKQIDQIKESIKQFGFNDPIALWHGEIVEGNGRYAAAQAMGLEKVPVIRLDELTDEQRRAYALVHNKSAEFSDWLTEVIKTELDDISNIDMAKFGFSLDQENPYSAKVKVPVYEPTGELVTLTDCVDTTKYEELVKEIEASSVSEADKDFLIRAASRHLVFNYKAIAEYYARADAELQELMENSALVIIDINSAIEKGYCRMMNKIEALIDDRG